MFSLTNSKCQPFLCLILESKKSVCGALIKVFVSEFRSIADCMISVRLESTEISLRMLNPSCSWSSMDGFSTTACPSHSLVLSLSLSLRQQRVWENWELIVWGARSQLGGFTLTRERHFGTHCSQCEHWQMGRTYFYLSHNYQCKETLIPQNKRGICLFNTWEASVSLWGVSGGLTVAWSQSGR